MMFLKHRNIVDLFVEHVKKRPHSTAVIDNNEVFTYQEIYENSTDLAQYFQFLGVMPDDGVGLFVEQSVELMFGVWGILMSGAAYLPLSPEYPDERIKYMIENSDVKVIYTQKTLKEKLSQWVGTGISIITTDDVILFKMHSRTVHYAWKNNILPHHLAYIIYTSGSTGKPKGVLIEHHSILNQMCWLKRAFCFNEDSVILQKTPICFDAAQWEILLLCCGSQVVIGHTGIHRDSEQLIHIIHKQSVTTLQCVPTLLQALVDNNEFQYCQTLTHIFSGGEALSAALALQCTRLLPSCCLVNLYGPTECTINSSAFVVEPDKIKISDDAYTISIGVPIDNMQYFILDKNHNAVSIGEVGELYIGGKGLARGYLGLPELTEEKFIQSGTLYKTGDLARWHADGNVQYIGRTDNQIKLRGFRIELDEIKSSIVSHDWVKHAVVIVIDDQQTGYQNLVAFVELNSKEAALMDQGNHDAHHQSKESKAQVLMQLSNKGCREIEALAGKLCINLPRKIPTKKQSKKIFARKTYRFFEGGTMKKNDLLQLMNTPKKTCGYAIVPAELSYPHFGEILRYFGQYISRNRLLPKYGYASPGALYATQMYFELHNVFDLEAGYYYYHPVHHQLILIKKMAKSNATSIKIHFIGKKSAIEPIYKNNIREVLEIETGHMVGLFEDILPEYGLCIVEHEYKVAVKNALAVSAEDFYLGTFQIVSGKTQVMDDAVDLYVQAHASKIDDCSLGLYHHKQERLEKVSEKIIQKRHVIAINQAVYDRSSFGGTIMSKTKKQWMAYINLGRKLQQLQMNTCNIGLISSGYSSKTGDDLPSAKEIRHILGDDRGPSYFFMGGRISHKQVNSRGMEEDIVHMKGPAEMLKDDLKRFLPDYMIPNKIIVVDKMPLTVHGKIDHAVLKQTIADVAPRMCIMPKNALEENIHAIWCQVIKKNVVSVNDNFFELGGNSLMAVSLMNKINKTHHISLPLQTLFESPTIEHLAAKIQVKKTIHLSRLISLQTQGLKKPIYCWPGLGGYCMNLRLLSAKIGIDRPFYGVQTYGINADEIPYATLMEMAREDVKLIKKTQPTGPYTLWGYSFGARVAFEVAYQLEQLGETVENLFLIAPGSPKLSTSEDDDNKEYLTILFSVFMGTVAGQALEECLKTVHDEDSFVDYILRDQLAVSFDEALVRKIIHVVSKTYGLTYSLDELKKRTLKAPITLFKAHGDKNAVIESAIANCRHSVKFQLTSGHYSVLKESGINELIACMHQNNVGHTTFSFLKNDSKFYENAQHTIDTIQNYTLQEEHYDNR